MFEVCFPVLGIIIVVWMTVDTARSINHYMTSPRYRTRGTRRSSILADLAQDVRGGGG